MVDLSEQECTSCGDRDSGGSIRSTRSGAVVAGGESDTNSMTEGEKTTGTNVTDQNCFWDWDLFYNFLRKSLDSAAQSGPKKGQEPPSLGPPDIATLLTKKIYLIFANQ